MAVTPQHYSLLLTSIVKQGYSPSVQTPDSLETSTLWLTGDLRVCFLSSWDPISLPIQVPTSFLPSLPSHQKIHTHTHTQISSFHHLMCILITAISLLCYCESHSLPGWPFLRKQTSGDSILNCPTFSIQLVAAQFVLLQSLSIWGG